MWEPSQYIFVKFTFLTNYLINLLRQLFRMLVNVNYILKRRSFVFKRKKMKILDNDLELEVVKFACIFTKFKNVAVPSHVHTIIMILIKHLTNIKGGFNVLVWCTLILNCFRQYYRHILRNSDLITQVL